MNAAAYDGFYRIKRTVIKININFTIDLFFTYFLGKKLLAWNEQIFGFVYI